MPVEYKCTKTIDTNILNDLRRKVSSRDVTVNLLTVFICAVPAFPTVNKLQ